MVSREDKVEQLHITVFGAEGQGGLFREVSEMDKRIAECERKINVVSGKWLALMTLLAIAGNFLARILVH